MKKLLLFVLFPGACFAQQYKNLDANRNSIDKNIYRIVLKDDALGELKMLNFQYERKIKKSLTILLEGGAAVNVQTFGDLYDSSKSKHQFAFSVFGSVESRYYFNLAHRIKKEKAVRNFSAFYLSLQEYMLSNPFLLINQKVSRAYQGNIQTFLNIGWQKQIQSLYLHAYAGPALFKKTLSKFYPDEYIRSWQMGIAIGLAL